MQRDRDDTHRLRCAHCGYDLFGLPNDVCPECGHEFDPESVPPLPDLDLAKAAAAVAVGLAILVICGVIYLSLEEVQSWGSWRGCGRRSNTTNTTGHLIFMAHPMLAIMLWHARTHRISRRIVLNAILAVLTSWITAVTILEHA